MSPTLHRAIPLLAVLAAACGTGPAPLRVAAPSGGVPDLVPVRDSFVTDFLEATGVAAPIQQATLSTRLLGAVTAVLVHEGDRVRAGQLLVRLDIGELQARGEQAQAGLRAAEAQAADADRHAARIRALYADSAAPKAMLDAAETAVARANAGVAQARGAEHEVAAVAAYGELRAPFTGVVTRRWVDPGAFAAPGAPLITIEDGARLRVSVTTTPLLARTLHPGTALDARIEDQPAIAIVEGVVPVQGGGLYTVNAIVRDAEAFASGGAATLLLPSGGRPALLVPRAAIVRQGDLTGVRVWQGEGAELRWVRLGAERGELVEVLSGLQGDAAVVLPRVVEGA